MNQQGIIKKVRSYIDYIYIYIHQNGKNKKNVHIGAVTEIASHTYYYNTTNPLVIGRICSIQL